MRPTARLCALIATIVVLSAGSAGAFNPFSDSDVVWEQELNVHVKLAPQDSSRFGANEHPVQLNPTEVQAVVQALAFEAGDNESAQPVFTPRQAELLGKQLAAGLERAGPAQDVVFALDRREERILGLEPSTYFVAGRAFFKDRRLNLIVGDYDRPRIPSKERAYDPTRMGIVKYAFNYGQRGRASDAIKDPVLVFPGMQKMGADDRPRDDWYAFDLAVATTGLAQRAQQQEIDAREAKRRELIEILGAEEAARVQQGAGRPAAVAPAAAPPPPAPQPVPQTVPYAVPQPVARPSLPPVELHPVEQRLVVLKRLLDRGLITEAEFEQKRTEILKDL